MDAKVFTLGLRAITSVTQYAKKIDDDSANFIWLTLDQQVKQEVTDEMWVWAVKKTMETWNNVDHDPPLHIIVLSKLYRECNGMPEFDWGLKPDLNDRMLPVARKASALAAAAHAAPTDVLF